MSERVEAGVGQVLREAREAQGLGVEQVAARLRLMHRQIEAIEADDFDALGRPVFARGFVRNYARLLELDPEPLLTRMQAPRPEQTPVRRPEPPLPRSWLTSPWLIGLLVAGLLAVAVPIGLYWWLNQGEEETPGAMPDANPARPAQVVETPPATQPVAPPAVADAGVDAAVNAAPAQPAVDGDAAAAQPDAPPPSPPVETPAGPEGVLRFDFGGDSWVEIRDASGRMLHRQLNPAGSSVEVRGRPPFKLLVGNAASVRMSYNGRPFDLQPFIDVTVARFTLEQ